MREILFRGKTDKGEWVYGNFVRGCVEDFAYIVEFGNKELCRNYVGVIPETIGQYTGLTDKNGTKIFEGDIVSCISSDIVGNPKYSKIIVEDMFDYNTMVYLNISDELEVIGNIQDSPNFWEGGADNG